jgi:hypothetical protein
MRPSPTTPKPAPRSRFAVTLWTCVQPVPRSARSAASSAAVPREKVSIMAIAMSATSVVP